MTALYAASRRLKEMTGAQSRFALMTSFPFMPRRNPESVARRHQVVILRRGCYNGGIEVARLADQIDKTRQEVK